MNKKKGQLLQEVIEEISKVLTHHDEAIEELQKMVGLLALKVKNMEPGGEKRIIEP